METAEQLLEKLNRQFRAGEPAAVLLRTLTALEAAIRHHPPVFKESAQVEEPVSVSPINSLMDFPEPDADAVIEVLEMDESEIEEELRALREAAELRQIRQQHLRPDLTHIPDEEQDQAEKNIQINIPAPVSTPPPPHSKDVTSSLPLPPPIHSTPELNDVMADRSSSLNDRFRHPDAGVDRPKFLEPIADLRQAIGINDRFRFINELFAGHSDAFAHAIRAINESGSYEQAVFTLQQTLTELGTWRPENPAVREMLHLLERRYA
jgi:hypothetical protein